MTQFRIDVVVDPRRGKRGLKDVERGLTQLERKANKTQLLLQKAVAFVGVGFAIRQLAELGDAFTNLQNRLRVVTDGTAELNQKTEQLLQVANRSRSSFESTAELYSRLALATRELNLEGADLVQITESINKAIILSGASAKEANNGLIQLSQGLASGRLTGDELRSTLEQLPVVADVIAKQLGVTRGELRKLGAEGKITSISIIKAFQAAEEELETKFAKTVPTLSQSFVVLRNNVVAFVGRINEGTGILRGFGAAIRFVGEELDTVVKSLALIGVTAGLIKIAPLVQDFFKLQAAIKAGTAVRLGSIAAINAQNKFLAEQAVANLAAATAELKRTDAIITSIRVESLANAIRKGGNAIIFEKTVVTRQLAAIEAQRAGQLAALIAAEKAQAAASLTAATNVTVLSRAFDKAKTSLKSFTLFLAANPIGVFVVALGAIVAALLIFRNDIKLTEDGLATFGDFIAELADQIKQAFLALGEFLGRAFEPLVTAVKDALGIVEFEFIDLIRVPALFVDRTIGLFLGLGAAIISIIGDLPRAVGDIFIRLVNGAITAIEFLPDVLIGIVKTLGQVLDIFITGQIRSFELLGQSAKQALLGNFGAAKEAAEEAAFASKNAFERASTGIGDRFARNIAKELDDELIPRLKNPFEDAFGDLGLAALNAFADQADFSGVRDFVNGLVAGAEERAQDRAAEEATKKKSEADKAAAIASAEKAAGIAKVLDPLREENRLLAISIAEGAREAAIQGTLAKAREALVKAGAALGGEEDMLAESLIRQNAAMTEAISTAQGLQTADEILIERLRMLQNAYDQGTISLQTFNEAQREAEIVALESSKNFADGWEAGLLRAIDKMEDFGAVAQQMITTITDGLVNSLGTTFQETFSFMANTLTDSETSWVDYREAIKATFKGLIDDILGQLAKLLAQKALLALLDAAEGGAFGATIGAIIGAAREAEPAATGRQAATANKPFLVGEEGPELFTPGQTGSISPNDQTIAALSGGAANNRETVVVQAPAPEVNVNTIVVDDPSKVPTGIESPEGKQAIRNVIRTERSGIKRDLG